MTWPTVAVVTTNVDATTDDPELAVVQIKDAFDKLNQIIAHVSTFVATVLDDVDAAAVRATIGLGALATLNTVGTSQIDADAVTYAKMQNVSATDKVLGRSTAGAGDVEEIACTAAGRALIDDADIFAQRITLGIVVKRKTADETVTSSVTLQDDDHLTFPIGANEEYTADFFIDVGNALTSYGIKIAVTTPSGATQNIIAGFTTDSNIPGGNNAVMLRTTTSGGALDFTTTIMNNGPNALGHISVWVLNGATPGNVTLQFAQSTSSGSSLTSRKGGHLVAHRVA